MNIKLQFIRVYQYNSIKQAYNNKRVEDRNSLKLDENQSINNIIIVKIYRMFVSIREYNYKREYNSIKV